MDSRFSLVMWWGNETFPFQSAETFCSSHMHHLPTVRLKRRQWLLLRICRTFFCLETSKCSGVAKAICIKVWNVNKPPTRVLFSIIVVQTSSQADVELARKCVKNKCSACRFIGGNKAKRESHRSSSPSPRRGLISSNRSAYTCGRDWVLMHWMWMVKASAQLLIPEQIKVPQTQNTSCCVKKKKLPQLQLFFFTADWVRMYHITPDVELVMFPFVRFKECFHLSH